MFVHAIHHISLNTLDNSSALAAQSVGMFIGFTFNSLELCITIAALYSTATMLFGGFYTNTMPLWLNWLRYGSIVYYGYLNMQMVEFGTGPPVSCAIKSSKYPTCLATEALRIAGKNMTTSSGGNQLEDLLPAQNSFIPNEELLIGLDPMRPNDVPNPIWFNTLCLISFFLFFRLLGYIVLRIYHKPTWPTI